MQPLTKTQPSLSSTTSEVLYCSQMGVILCHRCYIRRPAQHIWLPIISSTVPLTLSSPKHPSCASDCRYVLPLPPYACTCANGFPKTVSAMGRMHRDLPPVALSHAGVTPHAYYMPISASNNDCRLLPRPPFRRLPHRVNPPCTIAGGENTWHDCSRYITSPHSAMPMPAQTARGALVTSVS
jgi:hypothetical protein